MLDATCKEGEGCLNPASNFFFLCFLKSPPPLIPGSLMLHVGEGDIDSKQYHSLIPGSPVSYMHTDVHKRDMDGFSFNCCHSPMRLL